MYIYIYRIFTNDMIKKILILILLEISNDMISLKINNYQMIKQNMSFQNGYGIILIQRKI